GQTCPDGRCVLLWMQRAKRADSNLAVNLAVHLAGKLGLPVVAGFCLVPGYPGATLRSYSFMCEGLAELPDALRARNIGWSMRIGEPAREIPALAREVGAAVVVTDEDTLPLGHTWRREVAAALSVPLVAVETDTVVPPSFFPTEQHASHTIRPKLWKEIAARDLFRPIPDPPSPVGGDLAQLRDGPDPMSAMHSFEIDRGVPPSPTIPAGRAAGLRRLADFTGRILGNYDDVRDRPDIDGSSLMSPYLHYGQLGPVEIARAAIAARVGEHGWTSPRGIVTFGPEPWREDNPLAVYLDELITQRELAINYALRNPDFDRYEGIPEWGQATLDVHSADPRPSIYSERQLEFGETRDPLWNAAQRQMVHEGFMPNRLRMYWAKQLLLWTRTPREAFAIAVRLNDRYELDGRDPNGYSGIAWSIGGRHDRPFPPKKPVLGIIRPMGLKGMMGKFDVPAYIARVERMTGEPVPGDDLPGPKKTARQRPLLP
ncbi:MAG: deoxyribodipyrimidine photo-lyase, partial [Thermomicrobiales bacterium]